MVAIAPAWAASASAVRASASGAPSATALLKAPVAGARAAHNVLAPPPARPGPRPPRQGRFEGSREAGQVHVGSVAQRLAGAAESHPIQWPGGAADLGDQRRPGQYEDSTG